MSLAVSWWDAQELVEEIVLEDSLAAVAYRATVRLVVTPELPTLMPGHLGQVRSHDRQQLLLDGVIWTVSETDTGAQHLDVTVVDRMAYLDQSEDEYLWPGGETATTRIRRYAGDWRIPVGTLVDTGVKLGKTVHRAQTLANMIWSDLRETARQGGGLYRPRMSLGSDGTSALELVRIGEGPVWTLESVEETMRSRSLEGTVTRVKVLGAAVEDIRSPVLAVVSGQTELGTLQRVLQDEEITSVGAAQAAGKALLAGPQETVRVIAPDEPTIRAGDRVAVDGTAYIVCNVVHRLGAPGHMELELGSEEYVRRRYYA